jgi:hypothetical protein
VAAAASNHDAHPNGHSNNDGHAVIDHHHAPQVPAASAAPAASAPAEHTDAGLRKRVPGVHAQAVRERSPLLRSAAGRASEAPLAAETTPQAAENLASLLNDYTSGLERGRDDHAGASTNTEHSE